MHLTNFLRVAGNVLMPVEEQEDGSCAGKEISTCEQNKAVRQRFFVAACDSPWPTRLLYSRRMSPVFFRIALFHRIKEPQPGLNCLRAKWASSVEVSGNLSSGNIKWDSSSRQHLSNGKIYSSDDFEVWRPGTRRCSFAPFEASIAALQ